MELLNAMNRATPEWDPSVASPVLRPSSGEDSLLTRRLFSGLFWRGHLVDARGRDPRRDGATDAEGVTVPGNSQAKGPRADGTLESGRTALVVEAHRRSTRGRNFPVISQVLGTEREQERGLPSGTSVAVLPFPWRPPK